MLRRAIRTPRGVLALIAMTYLGAAILAAFAASHVSWFESHMREKYSEPTERISNIGRGLAGQPAEVVEVRNLMAADRSLLYEAWIQAGDRWPIEAPAVMVEGAPEHFLPRARRTLLCGSKEQQLRALEFLRLSGSRDALPILDFARSRAERRRESAVAETARRCADWILQR